MHTQNAIINGAEQNSGQATIVIALFGNSLSKLIEEISL